MFDEAALARVKKEIDIGVAETLAENPEMSEDDIWHDIIVAYAFDLDVDTARELCRTEFGYIPHDLKERLGEKDWVN
jgi:hypothetical protein